MLLTCLRHDEILEGGGEAGKKYLGLPWREKLHLEGNFGAEMQDKLYRCKGARFLLSTVLYRVKTGSVSCPIGAGPMARAGFFLYAPNKEAFNKKRKL